MAGLLFVITNPKNLTNNQPVFDHNQIYLSGTNQWRRIVKTFQAPEVFGTKRVPQLSFGLGKKAPANAGSIMWS